MKTKYRLRWPGSALLIATCVTVAVPLAGCGYAEYELKDEEAHALGMESQVYGYPLVLKDVTGQPMIEART